MSKVKVQIIFKNGKSFTMICDKATATRDSGKLTGFSYEGGVKNTPLHISLEDVSAIIQK